MREMPIQGRGWISSAQSYFCIHFRYKFSVYFESDKQLACSSNTTLLF